MSKSKTKKTAAILLNVVIWLFLIFAVLVTIFTFMTLNSESGMPSVAGRGIVNIMSDSMSPAFKKGDIIITDVISEEEKANLKEGDVITYRTMIGGESALNSHRIVKVVKNGNTVQYITQGDNRQMSVVPDQPVLSDFVLSVWRDGKTVSYNEETEIYTVSGEDGKTDTVIGGVGNFIEFLRTSHGFFLCVILPLILFFLYELVNLILVLVRAKNEKAIAAAVGNVPIIDEEEIKRRAVEEYLRQQAAEKAETEETEQEETETAPETAETETEPEETETAVSENTDSEEKDTEKSSDSE